MAEITAIAEIVAPNKYNNSRIYKICSNLTDKIYIGSTTKTLSRRLTQHKYTYKKNIETNNNKYVSSFEIIKLGDFSIVLIEECNFNNRQQLERREGEIIKLNINVVNKTIAGRTFTEYYNHNKEEYAQYNKQYQLEHKEQIIEQKKQYYNDNIEKFTEKNKQYNLTHKTQIAEYNKHYNLENKEQNIEKKHQYYLEHKEQMLEKHAQYYSTHKTQIAEYRKQYYLKQKALKALIV